MKLKEALSLAAVMLDIGLGDGKSDSDVKLVSCANSCLDEIASEYVPLRGEKVISATDGKIPYSLLGGTVYEVDDVIKDERKMPFKLFPSYIEVEFDGECTVRFCTRPDKVEFDGDVPMLLGVTPRVLAYGIAAEYLLSSGFYEQAVTWDRRFKDALKRSLSGYGERKVKARRWLI